MLLKQKTYTGRQRLVCKCNEASFWIKLKTVINKQKKNIREVKPIIHWL